MTDWALAGARERGLTARLLPTLLLSPSSFRGRESAPDEPLAAAGVGTPRETASPNRWNRSPSEREDDFDEDDDAPRGRR